MDEHSVEALWGLLEAAVRGEMRAWRQGVLCTRLGDGADGRMVILRDVDASAARLVCFSDVRAEKVASCAAPVALVFWDPELQLQLRVRGVADVAREGERVEAYWRGVGLHARENYRAALAPGSEVLAPALCGRLDADEGRAHFAVIKIAARELDALWLVDKRRLKAARMHALWRARWAQV